MHDNWGPAPLKKPEVRTRPYHRIPGPHRERQHELTTVALPHPSVSPLLHCELGRLFPEAIEEKLCVSQEGLLRTSGRPQHFEQCLRHNRALVWFGKKPGAAWQICLFDHGLARRNYEVNGRPAVADVMCEL